jgi:hypothetical protein
MSGEEFDVDVKNQKVREGCNEDDRERDVYNQLPFEEDKILTSEKSTNMIITQKEIPPVSPVGVANEDVVMRQVVKGNVLAVLVYGEERDNSVTGESGGAFDVEVRENVKVDEGGPVLNSNSHSGEVGLSDPVPVLSKSGLGVLGLKETNFSYLGLARQDEENRYSSISEPDEVLSPCRNSTLPSNPKMKRNKSCARFNKLGVPKCIQLVEAAKEAGRRNWSRRRKGKGEDGNSEAVGIQDCNSSSGDGSSKEKEIQANSQNYRKTPASGMDLISGSDNSRGSCSPSYGEGGDKAKFIEAAKLLSIQKQVGFTFAEPTDSTIPHLVDQELIDRAKKMECEKKEGDQ